jgi:hypothetical protein
MMPWNRFVDAIWDGASLWRGRHLRRAFLNAKYILGEKMYAAGIDDGQLAARITILDEKIRQAEGARVFATALRADRKVLVLHLADAALEEQAPLPGADDEYRKTREIQAALQGAVPEG